MVLCSVSSCKNKSNVLKQRDGLSFHRFPKDISHRKAWLEGINKIDWEPKKNSVVCSKHFDDSCFNVSETGFKILKETAVPEVPDENNEAHQQHRRAEASMRYRRYDEAIECHEKAVQYLKEAINLTTSIKAIESINLQCEYHKKQKDLAVYKKEQYENLKKNIEKQKLRMAAKNNQMDPKDITTGSLHLAITKTMDEADSIVELLYKRSAKNDIDSGDNDSIDNGVVQCHMSDTLLVSGLKKPKNDNVVIEELQVVNHQLRTFINQLLMQLETSDSEVKFLKNQVAILEGERNKLLGVQIISPPSPQLIPRPTTPIEVISDSLEDEDSSQFIFSPSDLSPSIGEDRELPPLPPLEMPDFDFESLIGQFKLKSVISQESQNLLRK